MRILLVEDEVNLAKPLAKILEKNNLPTDTVYDGVSGLMQAQKNIYDVILLDIMLPEMNGLDVLKNLRGQNILTPVLLLTAKDSVEDKVKGLTLGADDYLTKPFSTEELVARVKALARRRADVFSSQTLSIGDISLNTNDATVKIGSQSVTLTAKEAHILEILIKNRARTISKEYLLNTVWGLDSEAMDNTVEIYVHYLRKKLKESKNVRIITQRGLGYKICEDSNGK